MFVFNPCIRVILASDLSFSLVLLQMLSNMFVILEACKIIFQIDMFKSKYILLCIYIYITYIYIHIYIYIYI